MLKTWDVIKAVISYYNNTVSVSFNQDEGSSLISHLILRRSLLKLGAPMITWGWKQAPSSILKVIHDFFIKTLWLWKIREHIAASQKQIWISQLKQKQRRRLQTWQQINELKDFCLHLFGTMSYNLFCFMHVELYSRCSTSWWFWMQLMRINALTERWVLQHFVTNKALTRFILRGCSCRNAQTDTIFFKFQLNVNSAQSFPPPPGKWK